MGGGLYRDDALVWNSRQVVECGGGGVDKVVDVGCEGIFFVGFH